MIIKTIILIFIVLWDLHKKIYIYIFLDVKRLTSAKYKAVAKLFIARVYR